METHFFTNLPGKYKAAYSKYYTCQNLFAVRAGSLIFLLLNVIIRLLYIVFPVSLTRAENFPEFDITNWIFILSSLAFYVGAHFLLKHYYQTKKATAIMALFVFTFSLYIIGCGMFSSFISTGNPRNALTLYLISLTVVSLMCVFEYYETMILIISVAILFTVMLIHAHTDPTEMLYNQLVSLILLGGFYLISRYFFTYKANYWLQLIEIREKNIEIESASEFKSKVLGTVAHDLRNPIAAVESLAMIMEMDEIDLETQDNLNMMKASCQKARSIIDDLLHAARTENTGEMALRRTELNIWLREVKNSWSIQKDINDILEFNSVLNPAFVQLNSEKFLRVLDNLIGNALKFSKDGSKVEIHLSGTDKDVIIEVRDQGMGIPTDMLAFVFEPFSIAGRTGLKGEQSTGLGLSIVKQIVEKHKGKIEVESGSGVGSTFRITLPKA